jgi:hypothetical protein
MPLHSKKFFKTTAGRPARAHLGVRLARFIILPLVIVLLPRCNGVSDNTKNDNLPVDPPRPISNASDLINRLLRIAEHKNLADTGFVTATLGIMFQRTSSNQPNNVTHLSEPALSDNITVQYDVGPVGPSGPLGPRPALINIPDAYRIGCLPWALPGRTEAAAPSDFIPGTRIQKPVVPLSPPPSRGWVVYAGSGLRMTLVMIPTVNFDCVGSIALAQQVTGTR